MATIPTITRWFKAITGSALSGTEKTQARTDLGVKETFAELNDAATVDLPTINGPTGTALAGKAPLSHTHTVSDITDFPSLATVATSGSYSDLTGTPTIPSGTQVSEYLVDGGIHTLTSLSGVVTPDAANGRSQKFPLTENVTDFNPPTNLADGETMDIQGTQGSTPRTLVLDAAFKVMGGGVSSDIGALSAGKGFSLTIKRVGADYRIYIATEA